MGLDVTALHWARRHDRVPLSCPVEVKVLPDGPAYRGRTYDVSLGGVGLTAEGHIEKDSNVCVTFLWNPWQFATRESISGRVVSVEPDVDGVRVGVEFETVVGRACQPNLAETIRELYYYFGTE